MSSVVQQNNSSLAYFTGLIGLDCTSPTPSAGHGGSVVGSVPSVWRVADSNSTLAAT